MNKLSILLAGGLAASLLQPATAMAELITSVGVKTIYDDNIYGMEKNDVDSWIVKVDPNAQMVIEQGANSYTVDLGAEAGAYRQSHDDDYLDYHLNGKAVLDFDLRNRLQVDLSHKYGHDPRGFGRTDISTKDFNNPAFIALMDIAEPDEWQRDGVAVQYGYGAEEARGRVTLSGRYDTVDYQNHEPSTDVLNNDSTEYRATGYLKLLPRTSFLLEARKKEVDFDVSAPVSRDSSEIKYFVGAEWQATAKTEGSVRLGYQKKDPDSPVFANFNSTAWEANVVWRPKTYSALRLDAYRGVQQSASGLTYVDDELYTVSWKHNWSKSVNTEFFVQTETQTYENSANRQDDINSFGVTANYLLTDWVGLMAAYRYDERSSSVAGLDFEGNTYLVGAEAKFR